MARCYQSTKYQTNRLKPLPKRALKPKAPDISQQKMRRGAKLKAMSRNEAGQPKGPNSNQQRKLTRAKGAMPIRKQEVARRSSRSRPPSFPLVYVPVHGWSDLQKPRQSVSGHRPGDRLRRLNWPAGHVTLPLSFRSQSGSHRVFPLVRRACPGFCSL
jgi:hypothetical protein